MFGLSLSFLPFVDGSDGSRNDAPVVLSHDQVEEIGRELDALRDRTVADLGAEDRDYIYKIIKAQRGFEVAGRGLMYLGFFPPAWIAGVGALGVSKILDNMEIGHNVMHGQYDWMREPGLNSRVFEWDTVCPADQWKHSHNYMHHTYTNILGRDRDIGYGILRIDEAQKWNPYYLGNPVYAFFLMMLFEWGVMMHDLEAENVIQGKRKWRDVKPLLKGWWRKAGRQVLKDYAIFPALTGPLFVPTLLGNVTANLIRNVWAYSIIFCGHFPTGVQSFTEDETAEETRGEWYVRQMLGSANIEGSPLFHIMSGNLSHQIEHHLFPDLPAHRYPEMAPAVKALCEKHGLPYNTGGFFKQIGSVWGKIFTFALPPGLVSSDTPPGVIVERQKTAA
ncbi:fatty acid desaturase family protein [Rhodococcus opacus]|uniref:Fatty acid desaturase n=3 Tax=Rhodococcus opacus TaxID=37919 RepID=K8XNP5_RHOOP|nr:MULTISPECIES: acyl-CoA desaturase [Rhodococcus]ANS29632.1 Stearoyl-CoA 9-desaturase [Rhodococcus opacus]EID80680.1 fatty acid desaturase [Rhodococcus opacus RKJ300 = JCM 13270]EKT78695.1 fatty acid desaturase [Rhodococcus opacus M213]MBA8964662.1 linoleoyl-CoA desaturase [Rhodococcus opacus]MBP2208214.1 linoleoyl-CoA desaturase [Rhodococcus opacus]